MSVTHDRLVNEARRWRRAHRIAFQTPGKLPPTPVPNSVSVNQTALEYWRAVEHERRNRMIGRFTDYDIEADLLDLLEQPDSVYWVIDTGDTYRKARQNRARPPGLMKPPPGPRPRLDRVQYADYWLQRSFKSFLESIDEYEAANA